MGLELTLGSDLGIQYHRTQLKAGTQNQCSEHLPTVQTTINLAFPDF